MGTRHLICVVSDDDYRIAQYGQWDGYPKGQGAAILEFLKSPKAERLKENLGNCTWITNTEYEKLWKEFGVDGKQKWIDHDIYREFCNKHPELSRDTGAKILGIVAGTTDEIKLQNSLDFSQDSLFCEWAYVIDFDQNTFEIYRGFNDMPLEESERFYIAGQNEDENGMYPIKLVRSFDLSALPSEEEFLEMCEPTEDELMDELTFGLDGLTGM